MDKKDVASPRQERLGRFVLRLFMCRYFYISVFPLDATGGLRSLIVALFGNLLFFVFLFIRTCHVFFCLREIPYLVRDSAVRWTNLF